MAPKQQQPEQPQGHLPASRPSASASPETQGTQGAQGAERQLLLGTPRRQQQQQQQLGQGQHATQASIEAISGTAKHAPHTSTNDNDNDADNLPVSARWATTTHGDNSAIAGPTVTQLHLQNQQQPARSYRKPSPSPSATPSSQPQPQPWFKKAIAATGQDENEGTDSQHVRGDYNTLWAPAETRTKTSPSSSSTGRSRLPVKVAAGADGGRNGGGGALAGASSSGSMQPPREGAQRGVVGTASASSAAPGSSLSSSSSYKNPSGPTPSACASRPSPTFHSSAASRASPPHDAQAPATSTASALAPRTPLTLPSVLVSQACSHAQGQGADAGPCEPCQPCAHPHPAPFGFGSSSLAPSSTFGTTFGINTDSPPPTQSSSSSARNSSSSNLAPRFDKRGYPIKTASAISSTPSSSSHISPRSSPHSSKVPSTYRPLSSASASSSSSPILADGDFSRYYYQANDSYSTSPTTTAAPSPRTTAAATARQGHRLETIAPATTSAYDEKYELESDGSHYSSGIALPSWYNNALEPKPAESINSDDSWGESKQQPTAADGQRDFGINTKKKNNRRKFVSMLEDPHAWVHLGPEDDDDMHNPDVKTKQTGVFGSLLTVRGFTNVGCLAVLVVGLVTLFAGYPIITAALSKPFSNAGAYNIGGINASGQLPDVGPFQLIDKDTPKSAYVHKSIETGEDWQLVFSDEFNRDGRTFWPGDDPYWEAEDYHYWSTQNLEWYDPKQITTRDGHLIITFTDRPNHGMNYSGGLMSTWNRFCFTGGYIEASVSLPANNQLPGMWPAVWTLGNLGRVGYGGTLDGVWPYSYDSCDVGTAKNQSIDGVPSFTPAMGDKWTNYDFSYQPGQRLSRCTCKNSASMHPGPQHKDGTFVGRGAPEIDLFEASVGSSDYKGDDLGYSQGEVSQSAQYAPFNPYYGYINTSTEYVDFYVPLSKGWPNAYQGGVYQQAVSAVMNTAQKCYTNLTGCYSAYGFEYETGDNGYITWVNNGTKSWTIHGPAMGPNQYAQVGSRPVSQEPMYIVVNLGMSPGFGYIDYEGLAELYPVEMWVDYIRVYQDPKKLNIGCSPPDFPTADYIEKFKVAYTNPNITTYDQVIENIDGVWWPNNSLIWGCK